MSDTVIKVENLSKSAPNGHPPLGAIRHQSNAPGGHPYTALRDVLTNGVKNVARPKGTRMWRAPRAPASSRHATRHPRGPLGRATHHSPAATSHSGRGFHPELTGRENISLNGAILGMSRSAIRRKFDEIVAFASRLSFAQTASLAIGEQVGLVLRSI